MSARTTVAPTSPGERLIRLIEQTAAHEGGHIANITETGVRDIVGALRAALPYIPRLILSGGALDIGHDVTGAAVEAMMAAQAACDRDEFARTYRDEDPDEVEVADREQALYLLGVLVGAALAEHVTADGAS